MVCTPHRILECCVLGFVGKPEVKAPLANPRCRWEGVDGIELVQGRDK